MGRATVENFSLAFLQLSIRAILATCLILSIVTLKVAPHWTPIFVLGALAGSSQPFVRACRMSRGTALRPAIVWAGIAIGMTIVAQAVATVEPFEGGRPGSGRWTYLATLAAFASLISVLNARKPGGVAWAILMGLLVLVFLIPWLEGPGLVREGGGWDRLRLTPPWTIFYGLLVLAGVTNYLPTRHGRSAMLLGIGFAVEFAGLTRPDWSRATRGAAWEWVAICWASASWLAEIETSRVRPIPDDLGRLWAWFRDAWGVVWALRVQERFNRAAESASWPIRLAWHGGVPAPGSEVGTADLPETTATLAGLLRRFATAERLAEVQSPPGLPGSG